MNDKILKEDAELFAEQFGLWERLCGKTFLITGATGLIGSVMIKCLLELNRKREVGIKIKAVVRNLDKAKSVFLNEYDDIELLQISLTEVNSNNIGLDVDYIVHLASPTNSKFFVEYPVETMRTSIEGTTTILEYAKEAKVCSMVFASSLEVYGINHDDKQIEENFQGYVNPLDVRSSYNIGKRTAESLCFAYSKEYKVPVKIARLTQTTGAGIAEDDNRVIVQFARLAAKGQNIILHTTGEAARPYCYTTDAISALLYILIKGENGEAYNVANDETYISARDLAEYMKQNLNPNIHVEVELNKDMGYAPATKLNLDIRKVKSLGWKPNINKIELFNRLYHSLL